MSLDEVLKLLFFVPNPLRLSVGLGIVGLLILATVLAFSQDYGYREAVSSPIWLGFGAVWYSGVVLFTLANWRLLGWSICALWFVIFLAIVVAMTAYALRRNRFDYNELGFYQSREWVRAVHQPTPAGLWQWDLEAVKDLTATPLIVELRKSSACDFATFWPTSASPDYRPLITDISDNSGQVIRWRIQNLRRPARVVFNLRTQIPAPAAIGNCRPQISSGND